MRTIRPVLVGVSLALSVAAASAQVPPQKEVKLSIERQALRDALNEWAQQTGFQLVSEINTESVAPRVKGTLTPQAALERLLVGTPLTYEWLNDRVVAIRDKNHSVSPVTWQSTGSDTGRPPLHIAKFGDEGLTVPQPAANDQVPAPNYESARTARSSRATESGIDDVDEIVVTGTRLKRAGEGPTPVTVFDRERLDELGVTNVADVLNYLPEQPFSISERGSTGGSRQVRLRGLGKGATLVLINGRRTVTSAFLGAQGGFDLNSIPLAAVERIEVLSDSASAVYGADAVGGVVNIVLRSSVESPTVEAYYGAADGGASEARGSLTIGQSGSRFRGGATLDVLKRESLLGSDRDRSSNADFRPFGGTDLRVLTSNPGNISSATSANLPGLSSSFAAVPIGSSGVGLTPASFAATAGQRNLITLGSYGSIIPEAERYSGTAFGELSLTQHFGLFGEVLYADRKETTLRAPATLSNRTVPASNAFNPFGVPVRASYLFTGIGPQRDEARTETLRAVAGAQGDVKKWDWELAVLYINDETRNRVFNNVDTARVTASLGSPDPTLALNVFQDGSGGSSALLQSLIAMPVMDRYSSDSLQASAFVRGDLASLPAGALGFVIGGEARREKIDLRIASAGLAISPDRDTEALYSELRVPIVGNALTKPGIKELTVTLASRIDHYSDFGDTFNPEVGLQWRPTSQLMLRGSFGTSFRAPSLFELYAPATPFTNPLFDARRNETVPVTLRIGGNPDLEPEESESWTLGFVISPQVFGKPRFEVSYWSISQDQTIQTLRPDVILANEILFPDRVQRAVPTAADVAAGRPGTLIAIDQTTANFGELETRGVDARLSAELPTAIGAFNAALSVTWVDEYKTAFVPGAPAAEQVALARGNLGTIPRWRAVATLGWSNHAYHLSSTVRYISAYDDATAALVRTGLVVDSQTLVDIQGTLEFGEMLASTSWLDGLRLRVGVNNVLDDEPPFASSNAAIGYDVSTGDIRQRFAYVSLSKAF